MSSRVSASKQVPVIEEQHGVQGVLRVEGNPRQRVHVSSSTPGTLARGHLGELHVVVAGGQAALLDVQQPESVRRVDAHQDVVTAVESHAHHPVRGEP